MEKQKQSLVEKADAILETLTDYEIKENPETCENLLDIAENFYKKARENGEETTGGIAEKLNEVKEIREVINNVYFKRKIRGLDYI